MDPAVNEHCLEIDRCNQRGGRMLSLVDLIDAGTMSPDLAAYALAAIGEGASFMVGALPGGAGKTTVMGALLNLVPSDVRLVTADGAQTIERGLCEQHERRCYVCHEIGAGFYLAYLWGESLRRYFDLTDAGHMLATNLHADTFEDARHQVCEENGVSPQQFQRMNLALFLSVNRRPHRIERHIASVWESDGRGAHRQVFGADGQLDRRASVLVSDSSFQDARATIERLMASGARTIQEVRAFIWIRGSRRTEPHHDMRTG